MTSNTMLRALKIFAVLLPLGLPASPALAAACPAENVVRNAGQAVDRAARAKSAAAFASAASHYTDMRATALFALGRYRHLLPKSRESEFVALTRNFMGRFMLRHGGSFRTAGLQITDCKGPPSSMMVKAKLASGGNVHFKVYRARGGYLIRDMNVRSIWLAQQLRSTFVATITRNDGNIDALFTYLRR